MNARLFRVTILATLAVLAWDRNGSAAPIYYAANGHYYDRIDVPSNTMSWAEANAAAQSLTFNGWQGHLATIASQAENDFVVSNLGGFELTRQHWLGGYQDTTAPDFSEPLGGWRWVTGEPWAYTSWAGSEPNNTGGQENFLIYEHAAGKWNDLGPLRQRDGFIVEFEAPVPEPAALLLAGLSVTGLIGMAWRRKRGRQVAWNRL